MTAKAKEDGEIELEVEKEIYPLEAIQSACYTFIDRAHVRIASSGEKLVKVALKPKKSANGETADLSGDFQNELLHQALRLRVSESNQKIREFIVTKALVAAQPADPALEAQACAECRAEGEAGAAPAGAQQAPPPAPVDQELEAEIEKLLAEIEKSDGGKDPLQVAVPWEEKHAKKEDGAAKLEAPAPKGKKRKAS